MTVTTNPPDDEPEPDSVPAATSWEEACRWIFLHPENTRGLDRYIDDKFLDIFAHEDRSGAFSRIVTEGLSQNDNGDGWAPITSWRDWWQRAKRAENHDKGAN